LKLSRYIKERELAIYFFGSKLLLTIFFFFRFWTETWNPGTLELGEYCIWKMGRKSAFLIQKCFTANIHCFFFCRSELGIEFQTSFVFVLVSEIENQFRVATLMQTSAEEE
jgi:hypothetical protein